MCSLVAAFTKPNSKTNDSHSALGLLLSECFNKFSQVCCRLQRWRHMSSLNPWIYIRKNAGGGWADKDSFTFRHTIHFLLLWLGRVSLFILKKSVWKNSTGASTGWRKLALRQFFHFSLTLFALRIHEVYSSPISILCHIVAVLQTAQWMIIIIT